MSWAAAAIVRLQRGEGATVRPRGHSMAGKVEDGETVTLAPLGGRALEPGDVVLVRVRGASTSTWSRLCRATAS